MHPTLAYLIHYDSRETAIGNSKNCHLTIKSLLEPLFPIQAKEDLSSQVKYLPLKCLETYTHFSIQMPLNLENTPSCSSQTAGDCGIKTLDYYLKQNRAMAIPSGECNFHIFYYILFCCRCITRGETAPSFTGKVQYRYLSQCGIGTCPNSIRDNNPHWIWATQSHSQNHWPLQVTCCPNMSTHVNHPSFMATSNSQLTIPMTLTLLSCKTQMPLLL